MNELKCWVTRRYNGLYLVTAFKPVIKDVAGTDHQDAYIKYGDPVGYLNVSYDFTIGVFDKPPYLHLQPKRARLLGSIQEEPTHIAVHDKKTDLHYIYKTHDCFVNNVCEWFITKVFGIKELRQPQPVYFTGQML